MDTSETGPYHGKAIGTDRAANRRNGLEARWRTSVRRARGFAALAAAVAPTRTTRSRSREAIRVVRRWGHRRAWRRESRRGARVAPVFPRSARPRGAVVDHGPDHDARLERARVRRRPIPAGERLRRPRRGRRAHSRHSRRSSPGSRGRACRWDRGAALGSRPCPASERALRRRRPRAGRRRAARRGRPSDAVAHNATASWPARGFAAPVAPHSHEPSPIPARRAEPFVAGVTRCARAGGSEEPRGPRNVDE
jgi:hypothetical protein